MFNLTKRSQIALYVLVELAKAPVRQRSADELAGVLDASLNHVAKVLQALGQKGWVAGTRGARGGYQLLVDPKMLSMADVIELFESTAPAGNCLLDNEEICERTSSCEIGRTMTEINEQAYYTLKSINLSLLADPPRGVLGDNLTQIGVAQ